MRSLGFLLIFIILNGCAQRIKVPINRFLMPEAIGRGAQFEYRNMGFSSGVLDFSGNSTSNPLLMGKAVDEEFYMGLGISSNADLFVKIPKESSSMLGIKVQLLGEPTKKPSPGHKISFTLAMGNERDEFDQTYKIDLKSEVTDFSFVHGYRPSEYMLIYDGISLSTYHFGGTITGAAGFDSDEIDYRAKNILGAHIGVMMGGHGINLKIEYATQKIKWSNTDEKLLQSFATALSFGW